MAPEQRQQQQQQQQPRRPRPTRRAVLRAGVGLAVAGTTAGCLGGGDGGDDSTPTTADAPNTGTADGAAGTTATDATDTPSAVGTEFVAGGFANPLGVEFPPGDGRRPHVVDQAGLVSVVTADGVREQPFLDVRDRVVELSGYEERGLLGLAFHPDFAGSGGGGEDRVFVRYSAPATDATPEGFSHTFVLSSFRVTDAAAAPGSERRLLELPQPQANHNAGSVAFGPDGELYVATTDSGAPTGDSGAVHRLVPAE